MNRTGVRRIPNSLSLQCRTDTAMGCTLRNHRTAAPRSRCLRSEG
jgi:hypothetical protein